MIEFNERDLKLAHERHPLNSVVDLAELIATVRIEARQQLLSELKDMGIDFEVAPIEP